MAIFGFRARLTHALSISPSAECFGNYTGSIQCIVKALGHTALISLLLLSRAHIALTVLCCQTLLLVPSTLSVSHCAWSNMFVRTCSTSRSSAVSPICTSQRFIFTGLVVHQDAPGILFMLLSNSGFLHLCRRSLLTLLSSSVQLDRLLALVANAGKRLLHIKVPPCF